MTDDNKRASGPHQPDDGLSQRILDAVLELGPCVARIETEAKGHGEHLASIDRRLEAGSSQMRGYGTTIAKQGERIEQLQRQINESEAATQERRKRCSETLHRLGAQLENTGEHIIVERTQLATRAAVWKQLLAVLGLAIAAAGAFQLGRCDHKSAAGPRPVDMRR